MPRLGRTLAMRYIIMSSQKHFTHRATEAQMEEETFCRPHWWLHGRAGIKWPGWFDVSFTDTLNCFWRCKLFLSLCEKMDDHFQACISLCVCGGLGLGVGEVCLFVFLNHDQPVEFRVVESEWILQLQLGDLEASEFYLLYFPLSPVSPKPSWCRKLGDTGPHETWASWELGIPRELILSSPRTVWDMVQMVTVLGGKDWAFATAVLSQPWDGEPWDQSRHAWVLTAEGKEDVCVPILVCVLTCTHTPTPNWKASFLLSPQGLQCWWFQLSPSPWWNGSSYALCWVSVYNCRDTITTTSPQQRLF